MAELISKNRMSAEELVIKQNAPIEYFNFVDKEGKTHSFFVCGKKHNEDGSVKIDPVTGKEENFTMYGSPKAVEKFNNDGVTLKDFQFAEVSNDGGTNFVPCFMISNVKKTLGMELLRQQ